LLIFLLAMGFLSLRPHAGTRRRLSERINRLLRRTLSIAAYFAYYRRCFSDVHSIQASQTSERFFWSKLRPCIPSTASTTVQYEMLFFDQLTKVLLERVPARAGELDHIANGDAAMFARIFDDLHLQFRHC
jgi:hypothetical protein